MKQILLLMIFLGGVFTLTQAQSWSYSTAPGGVKQQETTTEGNLSGEVVSHDVKEGVPLFVPNAFTPNGDGINDVFYIPNAVLNNFTFAVFDRWGNEVYRTQTSSFQWNGNMGNRQAPEGVYVYVLEGTTPDGRKVKRSGTVSIMR